MNGNADTPAATLRTASVGSLLLDSGHLSAASGLVVVGDFAYVVADDEHALGIFGLRDPGPGRLLPLFDEPLPSGHDERKARKADLEALTLLRGQAHDWLFAVGSGSRSNRQRGALLPLDADGNFSGDARVVDLSDLYAPLHERLGELNIEGLFVADGALCLLQRASRAAPVNACIRFDADQIMLWLGGTAPAPLPLSVTPFELGSIAGVPLTFTDGCALPGGGWAFCAAAEDTGDSYLDGACAGCAVGVVDAAGTLHGPFAVDAAAKVEGIAPDPRGQCGDLLLVTDADDREAPALLLRVSLASVWPSR